MNVILNGSLQMNQLSFTSQNLPPPLGGCVLKGSSIKQMLQQSENKHLPPAQTTEQQHILTSSHQLRVLTSMKHSKPSIEFMWIDSSSFGGWNRSDPEEEGVGAMPCSWLSWETRMLLSCSAASAALTYFSPSLPLPPSSLPLPRSLCVLGLRQPQAGSTFLTWRSWRWSRFPFCLSSPSWRVNHSGMSTTPPPVTCPHTLLLRAQPLQTECLSHDLCFTSSSGSQKRRNKTSCIVTEAQI